MRKSLSAGEIFFVLLFDCVLMFPIGFNNVTVGHLEMIEMHCSGKYIILIRECQCEVGEIENIILTRKSNDSADVEPLAELRRADDSIGGASKMVPTIWDQLGWVFYFESYEITAQYFQSNTEINGIYICTVVVKQGSKVITLNATALVTVADPAAKSLPVEVLQYATQILAFLIFLTVFSCMFVLICVCTQDRTTVPEKRVRFNRWKEKQKKLEANKSPYRTTPRAMKSQYKLNDRYSKARIKNSIV